MNTIKTQAEAILAPYRHYCRKINEALLTTYGKLSVAEAKLLSEEIDTFCLKLMSSIDEAKGLAVTDDEWNRITKKIVKKVRPS